MPARRFDEAKFSARVKRHAGQYVAFQVRNQLRQLIGADFDPKLLAPLPTPEEEVGPPEVHLKRRSDPCPYSFLLRTDYMRPKVFQAWQAVKDGALKPEHAVRDLMNLVAKTHYGLENAAHRITREQQKITQVERRAKIARVLLGKALIPVRALTQVVAAERVCKAQEMFEMTPINLLEEVWGWASQITPNRYFDIPGQTIVGKRTNDCALILDAVGRRALEVKQRGRDRRAAVQIYLDALEYGAADPMADVPTEHRELCSRVDPACPQWPTDEPSGISQNELLKLVTGAMRGKRQKRIVELIRGLLDLELLQRQGRGRSASLILGLGPKSKRCPN